MIVLRKRLDSGRPEVHVHPERRRSRAMLGSMALVAVSALVVSGCGDSSDDGTDDSSGVVAAVSDGDTLTVGELLDAEDQGQSGNTVVVIAMLVDDGTGMRMCESLAESDPPQCGGRSVEVMNPEVIDVDLTEDQGVRWAEGSIQLLGWMEGDAFYVS